MDFEPLLRLAAAVLGAPAASLIAVETTGVQRLGASGVSWPGSDEEPVALWASTQPTPIAVLDTAAPGGGVPALAAAGIMTVVTVLLREGRALVGVLAIHLPAIVTPTAEQRPRLLDVARTATEMLRIRRQTSARPDADRATRLAIALNDLLRHPGVHGAPDEAVRIALRASADALVLERAALWRHDDGGAAVTCAALYERGASRWSKGAVLRRADAPGYFRAITDGEVISASDALGDPRTRELRAYFETHGVHAVLAAPVRVGGDVVGIFCLEHTGGPHRWSGDDARFAAGVAAWLGIVISREHRAVAAPSAAGADRSAAFLEALPDRVFFSDLHGRMVYANPAAARSLGYQPSEIVGHVLAEFVEDAVDLPGVRAAREGQPSPIFDQVHTRAVRDRYGRAMQWELTSTRFESAGVRLLGGVARDLGEANQRLDATFSTPSLAIAHVSLDGQFLRINQAFCALVGRDHATLRAYRLGPDVAPPAEQRGMSLNDALGLTGARLELAAIRAYLVTSQRPFELEHEIVRPDGTTAEAELSVSLARDAAARPAFFMVVARDVTARRRAAKAVRGLAEALSATGAPLFDKLVAFLAATLGARCVLIGQLAEGGAAVRTLAACRDGAALPPTTYDLIGTPSENVLRSGICYYPERIQALFPADAMLRDHGLHSYLGVPLRDREGRAIGIIAAFGAAPLEPPIPAEDVARLCGARVEAELQRQAAATALAGREEQLRQITESARDLLWLMSWPGRNVIYASRAYEALTGRPAVSAYGGDLFELVHPDDRGRVAAALAVVETTPLDLSYRLVRPDGTVAWIHTRGAVVLDGEGRPYRVAGVSEDVTAMRAAEDALRASEQRLAEALRATEREVEVLQRRLGEPVQLEGMVGSSAAMREVYRRLRQAAQSDVTVLITGESGTGKELAANALHTLSERRKSPFVAINCAAIPEPLLESELFGHVKGAFTGASRDKVGLMQAADGGTLFLDEIGDMSPALQVKVLRAFQERQVRRVGDERMIPVNVRLVSATHRDVRALVAAGKMREDFYYRIKVFEIEMPRLHDRGDDVLAVANHFVAELGRMVGKPKLGIAPDAVRALLAHRWPGNVRELRNAIEHALVTASGSVIRVDDLPVDLRSLPAAAEPAAVGAAGSGSGSGTGSAGAASGPALSVREQIEDALRRSGGNRAEAARLMGISRVTLWKRMRKLGMTTDDPSSDGPE